MFPVAAIPADPDFDKVRELQKKACDLWNAFQSQCVELNASKYLAHTGTASRSRSQPRNGGEGGMRDVNEAQNP